MTRFLDELALAMAKPMPRSRAIRVLGVAFVSTAVPILRPRSAAALSSSKVSTSCHRAKGVCDRQKLDLCKCHERPANLLPPETTICNFLCCDFEQYKCTCPPGAARCVRKPCQRPCGPRCCKRGEFCANPPQGLCCKEGEERCADVCCSPNEECVRSIRPAIALCVPRCPQGRARCGKDKCCPKNWRCANPSTGLCKRCGPNEEECDRKCCDKRTTRCCGKAGCCPKSRQCCNAGEGFVCCSPRDKCRVPILRGDIGVVRGTRPICCPPDRVSTNPDLCCPPGQVALNSPGFRTPPSGISPFCCPPGQVCGSGSGKVCVDLQSDSQNCGSCGNVCQSGTCSRGICALP